MKAKDPLDKWPTFLDSCWSRMEAGRREYGDSSFERPVPELVQELEEELFDVVNWSFIIWHRLQEAKRDD